MGIRIKLTKTGTFVLFLLFLFYVFSLMSQTGLMFILMGIVFGVFVINLVFCILGIKALEIEDVNELITTETVPIETKIQITNRSKRSVSFIFLKCRYGLLFRVNEIEGLATKHITPEIVFDKRGIYKFNKMQIETLNPFGLIKASKRVKCGGLIKVYPKLYNCIPPLASGFEPMLGGHYKGNHTSLFGEDFAGVRPYVNGDPVKFIHWKSTSKGLGVFVKKFNEEYSGKISFIYQTENFTVKGKESSPGGVSLGAMPLHSRYSAFDAGFANKTLLKKRNFEELNSYPYKVYSILDWAVRAMGSLAFASLDIGHSIEITDFVGKQRCKASPFSNSTEILEFLTLIESSNMAKVNENGDSYSLAEYNRIYENSLSETIDTLPKKSSLVFILTQPDEKTYNLIETYCASDRKVSIYIPFLNKMPKDIYFSKLTRRCFYYDRSNIWEI